MSQIFAAIKSSHILSPARLRARTEHLPNHPAHLHAVVLHRVISVARIGRKVGGDDARALARGDDKLRNSRGELRMTLEREDVDVREWAFGARRALGVEDHALIRRDGRRAERKERRGYLRDVIPVHLVDVLRGQPCVSDVSTRIWEGTHKDIPAKDAPTCVRERHGRCPNLPFSAVWYALAAKCAPNNLMSKADTYARAQLAIRR